MDDGKQTNQLCTIAQSVSPAVHLIPIAAAYPEESKMLPPSSPPTNGTEKEKNNSNIREFLMDLFKKGSEDRTSTPTEKNTSMVCSVQTNIDATVIPPVPTETDGSMTPPLAIELDASTTPLAQCETEAGMTTGKTTNSKQKCTPKPECHATPNRVCHSSEDDDPQDEEFLS